MTALSAIEGVAVTGEQGILGHALDRERRFWSERSEGLGLDRAYEKAIAQAMAVLTLAGGADNREAAVELVQRIPLLSRETPVILDRIIELLHETYGGERWIDPILPDLLGEHLVQVALEDEADTLLDLVLGKPV